MYSKLFASMYDGTLATQGPWQAIVTFQQMLILADPTGIVDMTATAISRRTTIPLDIIETGIAALEQPDPESRLPDEDGRRIVRLDDHRGWGWQIVNFVHYRNIRDAEGRREYQREWVRQRRAAAKEASTVVDSVDSASTGVDNVDPRIRIRSTPMRTKVRNGATKKIKPDADPGFAVFWDAYPKKLDKKKAAHAWAKLGPDAALVELIVADVKRRSDSPDWRRDGGQFIPYPATYLNGERFDDEGVAPTKHGFHADQVPL